MVSWKGKEEKSGGIATNIGVHFFDMLGWLFGDLQRNDVYLHNPNKASGYLEYQNAHVRWFLSIDENDLPDSCKAMGHRTSRSLTIDGEEVEFSGGFANLHTRSYQQILAGSGFGCEECRAAIDTVHDIRNSRQRQNPTNPHPFVISKL